MINDLKKSSTNIYIKGIVLFIIIIFISVGMSDFITIKNQNIVTFKSCSPITINDLINNLSNKKYFTEHVDSKTDDSENLTKSALDQLIQIKLIDTFVKNIGLSFNSDVIFNNIKNIRYLQNSEHHFDKTKFEYLLKNFNTSKQKYFADIELMLAHKLLNNIIYKSTYSNESIIKNIKNFFTEERIVSIITLNKKDIKFDEIKTTSQNNLKIFFDSNKEKFRVPEKRDLKYLIFDEKFFKNNKLLANSDNKNNLSKLLIEYEKLLDDRVAFGISIEDIASEFNIKPLLAKNLDLKKAMQTFKSVDQKIQIFDFKKDELSYPILNNEKIILIKTEEIYPSHIPKLDNILKLVESDFHNLLIKQYIEQHINELYKNINRENFYLLANNKKYRLIKNLTLSNKLNQINLPEKLIEFIFQTQKGQITPIYIDDDNGYIAIIENITINKNLQYYIDENLIKTKINQQNLNEINNYLYKTNNIRINYNKLTF